MLAVFFSVVFLFLNPLPRLQDARNSRRWNDVASYINAIKLYQFDNGGHYFDALNGLKSDLHYQIGEGGGCNVACLHPDVVLQEKCVDFGALVDSGYLPAIIIDPKGQASDKTKTEYYVVKSSSGALTIGSCSEEQGTNPSVPDISITR